MSFRIQLMALLLLIGSNVFAQMESEQELKNLIESIAESFPEDYDFTELIEFLNQKRVRPININKTSIEELKSIVFLSPLQIQNFFSHLKENGEFINVLELQSIDGFDEKTVSLLLPFITIGNTDNIYKKITTGGLIHTAEHSLLLRYGRTLEKQKGFTDLPGNRYLGTPDKFQLRYHYEYETFISASIVLEKDAGERFITKPMDFTSGSLALNSIGVFKKIVVGDYTLQFGQGLTLWSGFSFGKGPDVASIAKKDLGLKPYSSTNEYSFFRGLAGAINLNKNLLFTSFISLRKLDASQQADSENHLVQSNLNQTGLHRTSSEIANRNTVNQLIYGFDLHHQYKDLTIGTILYHIHFSTAFITQDAPYDHFSFIGKTINTAGLYYNYGLRNIYFFGEFGKEINGGLAALNGALLSLSPRISLAVAHRNYSIRYHNFFSQALSESSEASNERGFYSAINIVPNKKWFFSGLVDIFRFPWLKYRIDAPSEGFETQVQVVFIPNKTLKLTGRFRSETKQQNTDQEAAIYFLEEINRKNYKLELTWAINKKISLQNRIERSVYRKGMKKSEYGLLIFQDLKYAPMFSKITGNLRFAYFKTSSYNSRIYAYEDDVLYSFAFGVYSGKGFRGYLNLKYNFAKKLNLWLRYAIFLYPGQKTVGTYLDEIQGNKKSEVKFQLRYQF